jgi:hypothetical protein
MRAVDDRDQLTIGTSVEWVILADAAQVVNGKLYLLGGGWDAVIVPSAFPASQACGIAIAFRVPWNETNQRKHADVEITDEDASATVATMGLQFEVGRPAGITAGQSQRFQIAANVALTFPRPGSYVILVKIDGETKMRTTFNVVQGQTPQPPVA